MKKLNQYKIINIFLLISIFSHVSYLHDLLDNYILCHGKDGHIAIENINDCSSCDVVNILNTNTAISNNDCDDFSLNEHCFEEEKYLSQSKVFIDSNLLKKCSGYLKVNNKNVEENRIQEHLFHNTILKTYTTVSLLI